MSRAALDSGGTTLASDFRTQDLQLSRDAQFWTTTLLYTVPLLVPLLDLTLQWLNDPSKISHDGAARMPSRTRSQLKSHQATSLVLGLQLIVSIWTSIVQNANGWASLQHVYWLVVLGLSIARLKTDYRRTYIAFLSFFPLIGSLAFTLLPALRIPATYSPREEQVALSLQVLLLIIPLCTPRTWDPIDPQRQETASPEQTCSPFSYYLTYQWIEYLIRIARHRDVVLDDLPHVPDYDRAYLWKNNILEARRNSLLWTILILMRWELTTMIFLACFVSFTLFVSPLAMQQLLQYLESAESASINPYLWAILLLVGPLMWASSREAYIFVSTRLTVRIKAALTQLIFLKVMVMRASDGNEDNSTGRISNLMSSDIEMITMAREFFLLIVQLPVCTLLSLYLLYNLMGNATIIGFVGLLFTIPIPGILANYMAQYQRAASLATDQRLSAVNENLTLIRITKFFGWENSKVELITKLRSKEQAKLWSRNFVAISIGVVTDVLPSCNMFVTFLVYTLFMGKTLTASTAFTSIAYFEILRSQFLWVGYMSRNIIQSQVALDRIQTFLDHTEELSPSNIGLTNKNSFARASFAWTTKGSDATFQLRNLNIKFVPGLNVIIGPTGSGKSSLLLALLGEMNLTAGEVCLDRINGVAYVSQSAWLQATTIRNNILFGLPLVAERYQQVIKACALSADFKLLERGDLTEVGENGASLSGGQKQRISLARALYSHARTILLDDVLSALDGTTSATVFEKAITGELTKNKVVILVTHAVGLCTPFANQIIALSDGCAKIRHRESVMNLHKRATSDAASVYLASTGKLPRSGINRLDAQLQNTVRVQKSSPLMRNAEMTGEGRISRTAAFSLLRDFGSPRFLTLLLLTQLVYQSLSIARSLFPGIWADAYKDLPQSIHVESYLAIYAAIILAESVMNGACNAFVYHGNWAAAGKLHDKLLSSVFHTPLSWHEKTPVGRVLNRFARDIQSLDTTITPYIRMSIDGLIKVVFTAVSVATVLPLFVIPAILVAVVGIFVGELYTKAQISIKRLVSVSESPLFSHFGDTIAGIVTIRAFGAQARFSLEAEQYIDGHTRPSEVLYTLTRWCQIRADALGALVSFSAAILALTGKHQNSGLVGFSLSTAAGYSMILLNLVRSLNELEIELNSFERIKQYSTLEQEQEHVEETPTSACWPKKGDIVVKNLSVAYTQDTPEILKDISFKIKAGERIGIVGRSGSGKSTLAMSLLRFTHRLQGSISIDERNIEDINVSTLRQRVTIIPQDPILFSGTVRSNLDPFGVIGDDVLNDALHQCGLSDASCLISDFDVTLDNEAECLQKMGRSEAGRCDDADGAKGGTNGTDGQITLSSRVIESGHNLSQGQRQLLALARALVRRSNIVILDEATASVDRDTDAMIGETLRRSARATNDTKDGMTTIITIAHRLGTICDYDKVMVLSDGRLVEFDTPRNLILSYGQREDDGTRRGDKDHGGEGGVFAKMVEESEERDLLKNIIFSKGDTTTAIGEEQIMGMK